MLILTTVQTNYKLNIHVHVLFPTKFVLMIQALETYFSPILPRTYTSAGLCTNHITSLKTTEMIL